MLPLKQNALFLILQPLALLLFPPALLLSAGAVPIMIVVALAWGLSWMIWRRRQWALTLSIFVQGLNVIARLMMLLSNAIDPTTGQYNIMFIITSVLAIVLSGYILYRFDTPDMRAVMVA